MPRKRWQGAAAGVVAVAAAGCAVGGGGGGGVVSGPAGPMMVSGASTSFFTPVLFEGQADLKAATVRVGKETARVTADGVEFPGGGVVPIPPGCKSVELREAPGGVRVFLDGAEAR